MHALPPWAVVNSEFPFSALAAHVGKLPLGGQREVALATYMAARLVLGVVGERPLPTGIRAQRAAAARQWCASLSIPSPFRAQALRLFDATAGDDADATRQALEEVLAAATSALSPAARTELRQVLTRLHPA